MNSEQKQISADKSGKLAAARVLIYLPSSFSVASGLLFVAVANSNNPNDESGLDAVINILITGGLFGFCLLITLVCIPVGIVMLKQIKNSGIG